MLDIKGINLLLVLKIVKKKLVSLMSSSKGEIQRLFTAVEEKNPTKSLSLSVLLKIKVLQFNLKTD